MKFKKGDTIIVTVGKDKGKKAKIETVMPKENAVIVPGMNVVKRHMKQRDERNAGGIIEKAKPLNVAKIALLCPKCNKPTRIGYIVTKGEKVRICKKCEQKI